MMPNQVHLSLFRGLVRRSLICFLMIEKHLEIPANMPVLVMRTGKNPAFHLSLSTSTENKDVLNTNLSSKKSASGTTLTRWPRREEICHVAA